MSRAPDSNPYGSARVAAGIRHFLLGKAVTSIAGVGTLLIVIRNLPIEQFAAYSVLFGLVDVLLVLTSVGTAQIMTRFVPELYARRFNHAMRILLGFTLGTRFLVLVLVLLVIGWLAQPFAGLIGLGSWQSALELYLLVVLFRTANFTLFQVLEATLNQAIGQGAFAAVTVSRFAGVLWLVYSGQLTLTNLILVELATDALGLLLMGIGVWRVCRVPGAPEAAEAERRWLRDNRRRILTFGLKGYFQVLVIMPFSGMTNRLIVGSQLGAGQVALFGFAQSIYDLMQRYLPAQFFAGMLRPVMAARFSRSRGFEEAGVITNATLKVNLLITGLATSVLVAGGGPMLLAVSNGKYGADALTLMLVMFLLLSLESWRHVLDQLCHTVERYGFLVFSNGVLGSSLLLGLALIPRLGVLALPVANCVGLVIANLMVLWWLRRTGYRHRHDLGGIVLVLLATASGVCAGLLVRSLTDVWALPVASAAAAFMLFVALALRPTSRERKMVSFFVAKRRTA